MQRGLRNILAFALATAAAVASTSWLSAEPLPKLIRVAVGTQGNFGKPRPSGLLGYGLEKGFFDQEFAKDGIKIEVVPFAGDGVQMNEALANQQVDFSGGGTLPNVIGLAGWNDAHIVFVQRTGAGQYLLTRPGIRDFAQLKGKRIGVQFGNISHILTVALLAAHNISESDVTWINLPTAEQKAALISGAVDAISGGVRDLSLRDRGVVNIIGTTRDLPALAINVGGTLVSGAFEKAYPSVVARYVKVLTKLAWWASQPQNRADYLRFTAQASRIPYGSLDADTPNPLKPRLSPLFDAQVVKGYTDAEEFALSHKLIRVRADVNSWFEPRYLNAAIVSLGLQSYWTPSEGTGFKTIKELEPLTHAADADGPNRK